jgi:TP901 family phage tail tape measure protein
MQFLRELVNKISFQLDTGSLAKYDQAVDKLKGSAATVGQAMNGMARTVDQAGKTAEAAGRRTGQALTGMGEAAARSAAAIRSTMEGVSRELRAIDQQALLFGKGFDVATAKANALGAAMRRLTLEGVAASNPHMQGLKSEYDMAIAAAAGAAAHGGGHGGGLLGRLGHHFAMLGGTYLGFTAAERSFEHFAEFQQGMQKAGAAMLAGPEQIKAMHDQIIANAGKLGQSPRALAEVDMELAGQGFEEKQVMAMMPLAAKLARAGLTDTKTSAELLGSTQRSYYGEDTSHVAKVADLLARTHDAGGISLPQLAEAQKYAAPTFGAMNQKIEDQMALMAMLGRAGIKGSLAGHALSSILIKAAAPTEMGKKRLTEAGFGEELKKGQKSDVLKELGIETGDGHLGMRSLTSILQDVFHKTAGMDIRRRARIFKDLAGLEDIPQLNALAKLKPEQFDEIAHKIHNADGTLDRMYETMAKGLTPAWGRLAAKAETFATVLIEHVAPGLETVLDFVGDLFQAGTDLIQWFDDATDHGKKLEGAMKGLRLALVLLAPGAAVIGMHLLAGVLVDTVIPAVIAGTAAAWAFLAPWLPIVGGLALATAAVLIFQDSLTWMNGGDSELGGVWDWIYNKAYDATEGMLNFVDMLHAKFDGAMAAMQQAGSDFWSLFYDFGYNTMDKAQALWSVFASWVSATIDQAEGYVEGGFSNIYDTIAHWIDEAKDKIAEVAQAVADATAGIPGLGEMAAAAANAARGDTASGSWGGAPTPQTAGGGAGGGTTIHQEISVTPPAGADPGAYRSATQQGAHAGASSGVAAAARLTPRAL